MQCLWDEQKNEWLKSQRLVSFEEVSEEILQHRYLDIIKHPNRDNQRCFLIRLNGYVWVVPFVVDEYRRLVLKTAYPSRKYQKRYGGEK